MSEEPKGKHSCLRRQKARVDKAEADSKSFLKLIWKLIYGLTALSSKHDLACEKIENLEGGVKKILRKRKNGKK